MIKLARSTQMKVKRISMGLFNTVAVFFIFGMFVFLILRGF